MVFTLYPYKQEMKPFVNYWNNKHAADCIACLVMPLSWGRASCIEGDDTCIEYSNDFSECIEKTDGLIIVDTLQTTYMYDDIVNKIKYSLEAGKIVYCCIALKDKDLEKLILSEKGKMIYVNGNAARLSHIDDTIRPQDCIVVAIGDLVRGLDSSCLLCGIAHNFELMGYHVAIASPYNNLNLLDNHHTLPVSHNEAIEDTLLLNSFINHIQDESKPDIILFHFSDGMLKYSDEIHCGFGINAFIESQALNIDFFILCVTASVVLYGKTTDFEELRKLFLYRFNCDLGAIVASGYSVSVEDTESPSYPSMEKCSTTELEKRIQICNEELGKILIYSLADRKASKAIVDRCIHELSENIAII